MSNRDARSSDTDSPQAKQGTPSVPSALATSDDERKPTGNGIVEQQPIHPPLPEPVPARRRAELERLLDAEFADGEDVDDTDDEEMYYPR